MKRMLLTLALIISAGVVMHAQAPGKEGAKPDFEKMARMSATRISEGLALDDATSVKFIPLYVEYAMASHAVNNEFRSECKKGADRSSDAEIDAMIRKNFQKSRKLLDLRETYYEKFLKVLNPRQIQKMYQLEKQEGERAMRMMQGGGRFKDISKMMNSGGKFRDISELGKPEGGASRQQ